MSHNISADSTTKIQAEAYSTETVNEEAKTTGNMCGCSVTVTADVDPTTKDDELMSIFKAEKDTGKNISNAKKQKKDGTVNKAAEVQKSENPLEQSQQMRTLKKNTELRLQSMSRDSSSKAIKERAGKLFEGSEDKYQNAFDKMTGLATGSKAADYLNVAASEFADVAEQHNALQIASQAINEDLVMLEGGTLQSDGTPGSRRRVTGQLNETNRKIDELTGKDSEEDKEALQKLLAEKEAITERIAMLREKTIAVNSAIGMLMDRDGKRITDTYKLAPALKNEVGNNKEQSSITLTKDLNSLILDKVLPLNGNTAETYKMLFENLIMPQNQEKNSNATSESDMVKLFEKNLEIVVRVLSTELQNLEGIRTLADNNGVALAIMQSLRAATQFGSVFVMNVALLSQVAKSLNITMLPN